MLATQEKVSHGGVGGTAQSISDWAGSQRKTHEPLRGGEAVRFITCQSVHTVRHLPREHMYQHINVICARSKNTPDRCPCSGLNKGLNKDEQGSKQDGKWRCVWGTVE